MRIGGKRVHMGRLPYLIIFLAGLVLGVLLMNAGKALFLDSTGLLDEYSLYHMKYMTVDGNALFLYVLQQRLKDVLFMAVMSTTYLGLVVISGMLLWYGAAAGMFLSAVVIRYGMKGILLALTSVFPQYILYIPAMICLIVCCEQTCRSIYFKNSLTIEDSVRGTIPRRLLQLAVITAVVITGCALESYVNPHLLSNLLKIF